MITLIALSEGDYFRKVVHAPTLALLTITVIKTINFINNYRSFQLQNKLENK